MEQRRTEELNFALVNLYLHRKRLAVLGLRNGRAVVKCTHFS
jgi:hypothetical protein